MEIYEKEMEKYMMKEQMLLIDVVAVECFDLGWYL